MKGKDALRSTVYAYVSEQGSTELTAKFLFSPSQCNDIFRDTRGSIWLRGIDSHNLVSESLVILVLTLLCNQCKPMRACIYLVARRGRGRRNKIFCCASYNSFRFAAFIFLPSEKRGKKKVISETMQPWRQEDLRGDFLSSRHETRIYGWVFNKCHVMQSAKN